MAIKNLRALKIKSRLFLLIKQPFFWMLSLLGNSIILVGAILLYKFESQIQTPDFSFLDALLWSVGIVTTVGYGNFIAITTAGKIVLLFLMFSGTVFVWAYMGFLVTGLISPELATLTAEVDQVEKELRDIIKDTRKK